MFKFLIGPERETAKVFVLHKDIVARESAPLDVLMNGGMSEAREGCVWLRDVDEETFQHFIQYLYAGRYQLPQPGIDKSVHCDEDIDLKAPVSFGGNGPWHTTPAYISCTRSYAFSPDKFDMPCLKEEAWGNFFDDIAFRSFYPERAGDMIELVQYVFKHTRDSDREKLRIMMTDAVIHLFEKLVDSPRFIDLFAEVPEFAKLFVKQLPKSGVLKVR